MKKILWYIDRDEEIGRIVTAEFPKLAPDYQTIVISNPIVIDEKLKEKLPDIIFIDSAIAEQDEAIIIKDFRMNKDLEKVPLVILGNDVRLNERAKKLEAEALRKPFDMKQLYEKARELLKE